MADRLVLELVVDDKGTATIKKFSQDSKQALGDVGKSAQDTSTFIANLKNSWAILAAGVASSMYVFSQVKQYASQAISAYLEQEKAENKLAMAMKNMRDYSVDAHESLINFSKEIQRTTAFSDEATLGMMALLKTFGMGDDVLKSTTKAVLDLSVGLGIDLESAAKIMGKAFVGETGTLSRFGIKISETLQGTEKFDAVLAQVQQRFGGFAQGELDAYAGRMQHFKNMVGEAMEAIGKFILATMYGGPAVDSQTKALQANNEVLLNTESGYMRFSNEISPKLIEEVRKEGEAWEYLTGEVSKFKPVNDETMKAMEKMRQEIEKTRTEREKIGKTDEEKQTIDLQAYVKELKKAGVDELEISNYVKEKNLTIKAQEQEGIKKINDKELEEFAASWGKMADVELALVDTRVQAEADAAIKTNKSIQDADEATIVSWGINLDKHLEMLNANAVTEGDLKRKRSDEQWKIDRRVAEDIAKFTKDEYELKTKALDEEYKHMVQVYGASDNLRKWYQIKELELLEEKKLRSNDFWAGMQVAYEQDIRNQMTWGERGADIWRQTFGKGGAAATTLTSFFGDTFKGQLKSAGDYFNQLKDLVLAAIAKMLGEWLAFQAGLKIAGWLGLSGEGITTKNPMTGVTSAATNAAIGSGVNQLLGTGGGGGGGGIGNTVIGQGISSAAKAAYNYIAPYLGLQTTGQIAATAAEASYTAAMAQSGATVASGEATGGLVAVGAETGTVAATAATGYTAAMAQSGALVASGEATGGMAAAGGLGLGYLAVPLLPIMLGLMDKGTGRSLDPFVDLSAEGWGSSLGAQILNAANEGWENPNDPKQKDYFDIINQNPWFKPENLWNYYIQKWGIPTTDDRLYGAAAGHLGTEPEYVDAWYKAMDWRAHHVRFSPYSASEFATGASAYEIYAQGGIINEPITGRGVSGKNYLFGEAGPERIIPLNKTQPFNGDMENAGVRPITININIAGNMIADRTVFNEFVNRIYDRLSQLKNLGY